MIDMIDEVKPGHAGLGERTYSRPDDVQRSPGIGLIVAPNNDASQCKAFHASINAPRSRYRVVEASVVLADG